MGPRGDLGGPFRRMAASHHGRVRCRRAGEDRFAIYVWRSERYGEDTKTE